MPRRPRRARLIAQLARTERRRKPPLEWRARPARSRMGHGHLGALWLCRGDGGTRGDRRRGALRGCALRGGERRFLSRPPSHCNSSVPASVTGRLVTRHFVTRHFVTRHFVPHLSHSLFCHTPFSPPVRHPPFLSPISGCTRALHELWREGPRSHVGMGSYDAFGQAALDAGVAQGSDERAAVADAADALR